ncbi:MAG: hypothetical protein AAF193_02540, partial [Bacteroidota bacterium]
MKKFLVLNCLLLWGASMFSQAEIVLNEIDPSTSQIEIKNIGDQSLNIGTYWLCNFPDYVRINNTTIVSGNMNIAPGELLVVQTPASFDYNVTDSEMGLYSSSSFGNAAAIVDYVEWGSSGHIRSGVAVSAGIWSTGDFHPSFGSNETLAYDGSGNASNDWSAGSSTIGLENDAQVCNITVGDIELSTGGTSTSICVDGNPDPLTVITSGGTPDVNTGWLITDANDNILATPPGGPFDLDGAGPGTCFIWYIRYEDGLTGNASGNNLADLDGCFALSNAIEVIREVPDGGMVELANGGTEFAQCAG